LVGQADRLGIATLTRLAEVMHTGLVDMRGTTSPRLVLELLCARMLLPGASSGDAALLQRLERMERRMDIAGDIGAVDGAGGSASGSVPASRQPASRVTPGESRPAGTDPSSSGPGKAQQRPGAQPIQPEPPLDAGSAVADRQVQAAPAAPSSPDARVAAPRAVPAGPDLGLPVRPTLSSDRPASARAGSVGDDRLAPASEPNRPTAQRPPEASVHGSDMAASSTGTPSSAAVGSAAAGTATTGAGASSSSEDGSGTGGSAAGQPVTASPSAVGAVSPTDSSTIGVTDVRRVWPEVMAAVKRLKRTTQAILDSATVLSVDSGVLRIGMVSVVMARRATEPTNADVLRAALREVLGVDWIVRFEVVGAGQAPADGPPRGATGGPPSARPVGRGGSDPIAAPPPPPDIEPPDEEIPDDYGEPLDPSAAAVAVRDPEEIAIALLSTELGARRLDPPA
jgi:DNA polymerase-3 subunit gamma/tau